MRLANRSAVRAWLLILCGLTLTQQSANATIANSAHDFSDEAWSGNEICIVCHTPHNADVMVSNAPLWNHQVTTATFTVYNTTTMDATLGQPDGISKLCLSCHDGTVAIDSFAGSTGSLLITGPANAGTDLSNDHPISFVYDAALAATDGSLFDPTSKITVLGGSIRADLLNGDDKVECSSCHDVHNSEDNDYLLRIDNTGSSLCMTCHDK